MSKLLLYGYFRSSASYRVRCALNLKGLEYDYAPVNLIRDGGEQLKAEYRLLNPMGEVPCLVHEGRPISQSMAIFHYLDDCFSGPKLFPSTPWERAKIIQICETVNTGIQPIQNLKVLIELDRRYGIGNQGKADWAKYWITRGFEALERVLEGTAGSYAYGGTITAADAFIVPQVYNAHRFKVDMGAFPTIARVAENANKIEAFHKARPENQSDHPKE